MKSILSASYMQHIQGERELCASYKQLFRLPKCWGRRRGMGTKNDKGAEAPIRRNVFRVVPFTMCRSRRHAPPRRTAKSSPLNLPTPRRGRRPLLGRARKCLGTTLSIARQSRAGKRDSPLKRRLCDLLHSGRAFYVDCFTNTLGPRAMLLQSTHHPKHRQHVT
jgi:hypothetical protein